MISNLPLQYDFFTPDIIKKLISANKALAKLNGVSQKIPNQTILINSLSLQESKDSSEIENIITTHDELYRAKADNNFLSKETKEVENYNEALLYGFDIVKKTGLLTNNDILNIQSILEKNDAGFRKQTGTKLANDKTGETVYTPPQNLSEILDLVSNLEKYINEDLDKNDPLIKMAIIHHQFESIHPFYDGNGRTGRIINILFLVLNGLLDIPILYLSGYIIKHKAEYYKLLQETRTEGHRDKRILYMLDAVEKTSLGTIEMIHAISKLMLEMKHKMREELPKIYSKDLIEILFSHPYTKIEFLVNSMGMTRQRASKYLNILTEFGYLSEVKIKNSKFFVNITLFELLKIGVQF